MSEATSTDSSTDVRPVVHTSGGGNRSLWLAGGALVLGGILLFGALDSRRQALMVPETRPVPGRGVLVTAPPALNLPPRFLDEDPDLFAEGSRPRLFRPEAASTPAEPAPQVVTRIVEREVVQPAPAPYVPPQPVQPPVIMQPPVTAPIMPEGDAQAADDRVIARRLRNPSLTVPQGTIIAGVLETAMDSTRPGAVRALVSRDVKSFDGSRVLIPRGSRLYGEYSAEVSPGQRRALINWQRLTRPDAVIIDLDSPAADPLGRGGVEGRVNSHFLARFGGAILQSVLDLGVGLATRSVSNGTVIVAVPGSTQQITQQQAAQVQPTLRVQQGTSVSVFVARDLDFSTVDN